MQVARQHGREQDLSVLGKHIVLSKNAYSGFDDSSKIGRICQIDGQMYSYLPHAVGSHVLGTCSAVHEGSCGGNTRTSTCKPQSAHQITSIDCDMTLLQHVHM